MAKIAVDGVSLWVETSGSGEPLLLLHGLGSSGIDYEAIVPALAASHRVIVPDVRGHGRSDKPAGPYGVPLFAKEIAQVLERLDIKCAHVAGLSMGGMIAFQLAVDRPDLVRSLTIINSGPELVPRTLKWKVSLGLRVFILRWFGPRTLARILAAKLFPKPEQEPERQKMIDRLGSNDPNAYLQATRSLIGWSVMDRVREIACPVLVLASDHDYTPTSDKEAYVKLLRDARLVELRDSGHAAPADQPAQVIAAMESFFAELQERERRAANGVA